MHMHQVLYNLHSTLDDLADIEALVDAHAVRTLSAPQFLKNESSQVHMHMHMHMRIYIHMCTGACMWWTRACVPTGGAYSIPTGT